MLTEDDVVIAVADYVARRGWTVESMALATQHGDDIVATRAGSRLLVEAKGEGSSKPGTSRYGKSFTRGQVYISVAAATLRALGVASGGAAFAAVAFPDTPTYREIVNKALPAMLQASVGVFWVAADGVTTTVLPWRLEGEL